MYQFDNKSLFLEIDDENMEFVTAGYLHKSIIINEDMDEMFIVSNDTQLFYGSNFPNAYLVMEACDGSVCGISNYYITSFIVGALNEDMKILYELAIEMISNKTPSTEFALLAEQFYKKMDEFDDYMSNGMRKLCDEYQLPIRGIKSATDFIHVNGG